MAYIITNDCIGCYTCVNGCPMSAISPNEVGRPEINQELCVQCGTCYDNCPVEAIEERS